MITLPNLDCDVTSACSMSCASCNRFVVPYRSAKGGPPSTTPATVERDLASFGRVARTKRWAALGGEPTMHHALIDILRVVRASGVADNIAVWTNLALIRRMRPEFWASFDTLVASLYPGKVDAETVQWTKDQCREHGIELVINDATFSNRNWTRLLEPAPTDDAETQRKYDQCWFKTYCYALNFGHLFRCCTSPHIPQLLQGRPYGADGLCVKGLTEAALQTWLDQKAFMESCRVCCGRTPRSEFVPWAEERDPVRWIAKSKGLDTPPADV